MALNNCWTLIHVCVVWWCLDGPINSQEYNSFEMYAVNIKISMTDYHHWINGQALFKQLQCRIVGPTHWIQNGVKNAQLQSCFLSELLFLFYEWQVSRMHLPSSLTKPHLVMNDRVDVHIREKWSRTKQRSTIILICFCTVFCLY